MFDVYRRIVDRWNAGDKDAAFDIHSRLLPVLNHIRQNVEQIIRFEKRILVRRGVLKSEYCREPSFKSDRVFDIIFDRLYAGLEREFSA
jgi:4-hydroxy-tetrahydrodipicolinate synthase